MNANDFQTALARGAQARIAALENDHFVESVQLAAAAVAKAILLGRRVFFFGNGGSAADAQHWAAELTGRFKCERRPLPGLALTTDTSALTAIANDYGYSEVFRRQLLAFGQSGDVAIGISTSGNSENVVLALEAAVKQGLVTIALTGQGGGKLAERANITVAVPCEQTDLVQEIHETIGHFFCSAIDALLLVEPTGQGLEEPSPITDVKSLAPWREYWRKAGITVGWTNGCFDLLHAGHLSSLRFAKSHVDVLIVGVNSDRSVKLLKGESRPLVNQQERMELLAALNFVDHVLLMDDQNPIKALEILKVDIHFKGDDYRGASAEKIPERAVVEKHGGKVMFTPLIPGRSTTNTVSRLSF